MKHPNKDIEKVIRYAVSLNWTVRPASGHAWGGLRCPHNESECRCGQFCQISVWRTPKNPGNFAKQLKKKITGCVYNTD